MNENELEQSDKTYGEASLYTVGKAIAEMYRGLRNGGMDRRDAVQVILVYAKGLSEQRQDRPD